MTDAEFISYFVSALMVSYYAGLQWGKFAKVLKDLGRMS